MLWSYALARGFEATNTSSSSLASQTQKRKLEVIAFDPGLVPGNGLAREASSFGKFLRTKVLTRTSPLMRLLLGPNIHTPQDSGGNMAYVAMGEGEARGSNGVYFEGRKIRESSGVSYWG